MLLDKQRIQVQFILIRSCEAEQRVQLQAVASKIILMRVMHTWDAPFSDREQLSFCESGTNQRAAKSWQPGGVR